jgi:hypothetical protein
MTQPLREALAQCRRHATVLAQARADLPPRFDLPHVLSPSDALVRAGDQFVLRFIKLQDTLGEQVLRPFTAEVLGEPVSDLPLIDVLNRLERFGFLQLRDWARWRALRNALTHEYPDRPDLRVAVLNDAMEAAEAIEALLARLESRWRAAAEGLGAGR